MMTYNHVHFLLYFSVVINMVQSLIYPFGSRPSDTILPPLLEKEQPLTVSVLIKTSQMTNVSVDENFTLCFNFSNKMEAKMFRELKKDEKTISVEMKKMLLINIKNTYWIENENITCMVIENASLIRMEHAPTLTMNDIIRVVTLSAISLASLVGNIAVLTTIAINKRRRQSTIYLLISMLAIADLLVTTFCVIADAIWAYTVEWKADNMTCKLVKFFQMFSLYFSTFLLVVIGYDRFYAIRFPMRRSHSRRIIRRLLFAIILLSTIFSSPQVNSIFFHFLYLYLRIFPCFKAKHS